MAYETTPTNFDRTTYIQEVLASLSDDDLKALEAWRRSVNRDSKFLGGRGHSLQQMNENARAWDALSPDARRAYHSVLCCIENELEEAVQAVGPVAVERDIEAVEALLGPDHPAFRILPAHAIVVAYRDAVEQFCG